MFEITTKNWLMTWVRYCVPRPRLRIVRNRDLTAPPKAYVEFLSRRMFRFGATKYEPPSINAQLPTHQLVQFMAAHNPKCATALHARKFISHE